MEPYKSIHMHNRIKSSLHNSPTSSSPLRRKSIVIQKQLSSILSENDDEAERISRRREICSSTLSNVPSTSNKRHSLGLGFLANIPAPQMVESISQCIKLSAENKINIKNAFSLEMIDFMTYMIKKQDDNMSNLQVASTSLDVSTKIYGFRVDSVHTDILKIVGGLDKGTDNEIQNSDGQEETLQDDMETNLEAQKKKKKKKVAQKIFSTVDALRGSIEVAKPMSMMIGEGDLQTSDMLYQAILPNHANTGFYQHLYNDVLVDVIEPKSQECNSNSMKYTVPVIEDFHDLEICASYSNFEFLGWSVEDEPEKMPVESEVQHDETNGFQFDLDASVVEDENISSSKPINYFDIENDKDDENVEFYQQQKVINPSEEIKNVHNILIPIAGTGLTKISTTSEYSFVLPNISLHWAGPSHWKFRNLAKPSVSTEGKIAGICMQAPLKRRREIELLYNDNKDVIDAKFVLGNSNRLRAKTAKAEWSAESLTLPEDIHYDITQTTKLYLHPNLVIKLQGNDKNDVAAVADVSDSSKYDYNNPNDTSDYCPGVNNNDYDEARDDNDECNFRFEDDGGGLMPSQGLIGDNLVAAPKLANKVTIAYCLKAKRIDMRQLKKSIWKCLQSTSNADINEATEQMEQAEANTIKEAKQFSDVYKMLPKLLTKSNAEALSVPLSFISLLHLANEKVLKVHSLPDMSDIIVENNN